MRRRRVKRQRRAWTDAHLLQLRTGRDYFREAWGDEPFDDETLEEMRSAYARHGDEIEEAERERHGSKARSWAAMNLFGPEQHGG